MNDATACWVRGVGFITLFAPIAGAAVVNGFGIVSDAAGSVSYPRGLLDVLEPFLIGSIFALLFAGPVAFAAGLAGVALALRWARSGVPSTTLGYRLRLLGLALGISGGLVVGLIFRTSKHSFSFFFPAGTVVGCALAMLIPRVLGDPYRRLTKRCS